MNSSKKSPKKKYAPKPNKNKKPGRNIPAKDYNPITKQWER